jgi:hypothetical protein
MSLELFLKQCMQRKVAFTAVLVLLFSVSFAVPLVFAIKASGFIDFDKDSIEDNVKESLFPNASKIGASNVYFSIESKDILSPIEGKDFLLVFWAKIRKLPVDGERLLLLSKYDPHLRSLRGYALALSAEGDLIYPEVYWRSNEGVGTWLKFSEISIDPKQWTMFALSFREQKFLGLHSVGISDEKRDSKPEIKVLGGYELEQTIRPTSSSPLLTGAFSNGKFRGYIGQLGIFQKENLTQDLMGILEKVVAEPKKITEQFNQEDVQFLLEDAGKDSSSYNNKVEFNQRGRN